MNYQLAHPYPSVGISEEAQSCGGNQRLLRSPTLRKCGCGVVAGLDLARYIHLYHHDMTSDFFRGMPRQQQMSPMLYDICARRMQEHFLPVVPPIGTNGAALCLGMNRYFHQYGIPLTAHWGVRSEKLWCTAQEQLAQDLPVILSIGRPFPKFWSEKQVALYRSERVACHTNAHFVTMIGLDDTWAWVSSWGREYAIRRSEFDHYRQKDSNALLCNILVLRRKT